jgi:hypothetical protein
MKKLEKKEILGFEKSELTDNALQSVFGGRDSGGTAETYTHFDDNTGHGDGADPLPNLATE